MWQSQEWGPGHQCPPQCCRLAAATAHTAPRTVRCISPLCFVQGTTCTTQHCCSGSRPDPASLKARCKAPASCSRSGCQGSAPPGSLLPVFVLRCRVLARGAAGSREQRAPRQGSARLRGWCTASKPAPVSHPSIPTWEPGAGASQHSPGAEAIALHSRISYHSMETQVSQLWKLKIQSKTTYKLYTHAQVSCAGNRCGHSAPSCSSSVLLPCVRAAGSGKVC